MRTESKVDSIVLDWLREGLTEKLDQLLRALDDLSSGIGGNEHVFESLQAVKTIDAVLAISDFHVLRVLLKEQMAALVLLEIKPEQTIALLTAVTEAAWLLRAVLDRLSIGAAVNAMSLLPIINRLRLAQGLSVLDTENVLARSSILWSESRVFVRPYLGLQPGAQDNHSASQRMLQQMEQQILLLMRGDIEAIPDLLRTFDSIIDREINRAVVVATQAFEELLNAVYRDQERYLPVAKRMIGRVLRLFRMEMQGRDQLLIRFEAIEFATDLLLELVASLPDDQLLYGEPVHVWRSSLSTDQERLHFLGLETAALKQVAEVLAEELNAAQDVLDLFVRSAKSDLEPLSRIQPRLEQIVGVLGALNYDHESALIHQALDELILVIRGSVLLSDAFLMRLAIAVMTTEQVVSQIGQHIVDTDQSFTTIDRIAKQALLPLATACYEDVIAAKEIVNTALRPSGQLVSADALSHAADLVAGVRNALSVAQLHAAMPLIEGMRVWLSGHASDLTHVTPKGLSALAEVSAAIEFYLENLRDHQKEMLQFLSGALLTLPVLQRDDGVASAITQAVELAPESVSEPISGGVIDESLASIDDLIAQLSLPSFEDEQIQSVIPAIDAQAESVQTDVDFTPESASFVVGTMESPKGTVPEWIELPLDAAEAFAPDVARVGTEPIELTSDALPDHTLPPVQSEDWLLPEASLSLELASTAPDAESVEAWPELSGETETPNALEPPLLIAQAFETALPGLFEPSGDIFLADVAQEATEVLPALDSVMARTADQVVVTAIDEDKTSVELAVPSFDAMSSGSEARDSMMLEMRGVFAEEMAEEVPAIYAAAQRWLDIGERDSLMIVRRGFHTIKGSSRMVGLTGIGAWGWAFEHLLNHVLDDRIAGSQAIRADVLAAVDLMVQALPLLAAGDQPPAAYWQDSLRQAEAWSNLLEVGTAATMSQDAEAQEELFAESDGPGLEEVLAFERPAYDTSDRNSSEQIEAAELFDGLMPADSGLSPALESNGPLPAEAAFPSRAIELDALFSAGKTATESRHPEPLAHGGLTPQDNQPVIHDPVLREIFDAESSGYIQALRHQVDHALMNQVSMTCDKELARLVHTLLGSARTAGVKPIATIAHRLEEWVRLLEDQSKVLEYADLATFQRALLMMDRLRQWAIDPSFAQPDEQPIELELVAHIDQILAQEQMLGTESVLDANDHLIAATDFTLGNRAHGAYLDRDESEVVGFGAEKSVIATAAESLFARPQAVDFGLSIRPDDQPSEQDPDILQIFLEEAEELLEKADGYIAHWRSHPHDLDSIRLLHRNLHTLKGGARMAGLLNLADVTHLLEDRLDRARDRGVERVDHLIILVQHTYDALGKMLDLVRQQEPIPAQVALLAQIVSEDVVVRETTVAANTIAGQPEEAWQSNNTGFEPLLASDVLAPELEHGLEPEEMTANIVSTQMSGSANEVRREQIRVDADRIDAMVNQVGESVLLQARVDRQVNGFERHLFELQQTLSRLRGQLRRLEIETESQMKAELLAESGLAAEEFDPLEFDRFTQVQELSRGIMESLGDISSIEEAMSDLTEQSQLLLLQQSRLGRKLQDGMLALRMVRFNDVVGRLRRVVRQVGDEMGRNAELIVHNGETELDRVTLVGLMPSLEHMIRNSLAHGIESPAERHAKGKPEMGQIEITIESAGGNVTLELKDDGRGLDIDTIRRKAIERKLVPADIELTDDEARALIFLPGFSTAGNVSQVAGRGVGMDVVASAVREMGGFVDLHSELGCFTRIQLNLPLTQAMTRGILVSVGEDRYAIPYKGVVSVTRMTAIQLAEQYASAKPAVILNGERYPLFYLGELLSHEPFNVESQEAGIRPVFLFKLGERRFAIQVDYQLGGIQLFVKSLGPQLGRIPGLSGATIADDGNVILVMELFELVRQFQRRDDRSVDLTQNLGTRRRPVVLVVDDSLTVRKVTARTLERNNLDVILARDGVEALGILHEQQPDVVLTDIEMPRMDGFELLGAIRNDPQTRTVPVIMISSRTGQKHRNRAEALGVSAYLGKPYAEADLIGRIEQFLTEKRSQLAEKTSQ
ncbi:MAG: hybrid sensor histidine kinase/response regulator [Halothiobacillus sp.]